MNVFEDDRGHVSELEEQISALEDDRASAAAEEVRLLNRTMFDLNAECKSKVAMLGEQLSDAQAHAREAGAGHPGNGPEASLHPWWGRGPAARQHDVGARRVVVS